MRSSPCSLGRRSSRRRSLASRGMPNGERSVSCELAVDAFVSLVIRGIVAVC